MKIKSLMFGTFFVCTAHAGNVIAAADEGHVSPVISTATTATSMFGGFNQPRRHSGKLGPNEDFFFSTNIGDGISTPKSMYGGVFDGHGGKKASELANKEMHLHIAMNPYYKQGNIRQALLDSFNEVDLMCNEFPNRDGTTATVALIDSNSTLWLANVGDSRAILCNVENDQASVISETHDHKASDAQERVRVLASPGGKIENDRLGGFLAITRALGNFEKNYGMCQLGDNQKAAGLISVPEITEINLNSVAGKKFVIIASDGVWDTISSKMACELTAQQLTAGGSPEKAAEQLILNTVNIEVEKLIDSAKNVSEADKSDTQKRSLLKSAWMDYMPADDCTAVVITVN
ncbi:MAG: protein serine/threonine phosphatase 2C family protein [Oligoflexia bacterium]|nr:protein serine/threonine phosphatase 2C family protein [Oligoflexia bacterium]